MRGHISIHATREGGDAAQIFVTGVQIISIHATREGGDSCVYRLRVGQRTISIHATREGGDMLSELEQYDETISIHATREGGDAHMQCKSDLNDNFNPRHP